MTEREELLKALFRKPKRGSDYEYSRKPIVPFEFIKHDGKIEKLFTVKVRINSPDHAHRLFTTYWENWRLKQKQDTKALFIDDTNYVIGMHSLANNDRYFDPWILVNACRDIKAAGMIIAHNCLLNRCKPDQDETNVAHALHALGKDMQVPLLDYMIVSEERFYSFKIQGSLEP